MKAIILTLAFLVGSHSLPAATNSNSKTKSPKSTSPAAGQPAFDPVEVEFQKLLADDDAAQSDADKWISQANALESKGAPLSKATLNSRIDKRFDSVKNSYESFLRRHPKHVRARLAYGSFLNDIHEEDAAVKQWEKARQLDPSDPATWNNLANHFGHRGPVKKAFEYYEKAIQLDPEEPVYLQNLATTTYLFRVDAREYYGLTEDQVFDRALDLYRKALRLDPDNFPLATDYAQTYYGIKPLRADDAVAAWNEALKIASDDFERQGVFIHIARILISAGRFDQAREQLKKVTDNRYSELKDRVQRSLLARENPTAQSSPP